MSVEDGSPPLPPPGVDLRARVERRVGVSTKPGYSVLLGECQRYWPTYE